MYDDYMPQSGWGEGIVMLAASILGVGAAFMLHSIILETSAYLGEPTEMRGITYELESVETAGDKVDVGGVDYSAEGEWIYAVVEATNTSDKEKEIVLTSSLYIHPQDFPVKLDSESVEMNIELSEGLNHNKMNDNILQPGESVAVIFAYDWPFVQEPEVVEVYNHGLPRHVRFYTVEEPQSKERERK